MSATTETATIADRMETRSSETNQTGIPRAVPVDNGETITGTTTEIKVSVERKSRESFLTVNARQDGATTNGINLSNTVDPTRRARATPISSGWLTIK